MRKNWDTGRKKKVFRERDKKRGKKWSDIEDQEEEKSGKEKRGG